jgi:hypothetical protein
MLVQQKELIPSPEELKVAPYSLKDVVDRTPKRFIESIINNLNIPIGSLVTIENNLGKTSTMSSEQQYVCMKMHIISDTTMMQIMKRLQDIKHGSNSIADVNEVQALLSMF